MQHMQASPRNWDRTSFRTSIILTVLKSRFVHGEASVALADYDDNLGCIRQNIYIRNVLQRDFADSSLGPTQSRRARWWPFILASTLSNVHFLFHVKSDGVAEIEKGLALLQFFEVPLHMDEIGRELHCLSLRWVADDEIDHSINFNQILSGLIEASKWYRAIPVLSIVSSHDIVRADYSFTPFCLKMLWSERRVYVRRFQQYKYYRKT